MRRFNNPDPLIQFIAKEVAQGWFDNCAPGRLNPDNFEPTKADYEYLDEHFPNASPLLRDQFYEACRDHLEELMK